MRWGKPLPEVPKDIGEAVGDKRLRLRYSNACGIAIVRNCDNQVNAAAAAIFRCLGKPGASNRTDHDRVTFIVTEGPRDPAAINVKEGETNDTVRGTL